MWEDRPWRSSPRCVRRYELDPSKLNIFWLFCDGIYADTIAGSKNMGTMPSF